MKKTIALFLSLSMLFALSACGSGTSPTNDFSSGAGGMTAIQQVAEENGITSLENYPFDESRESTANSDERYPYVEFAQSLSPTNWQPYNMKDTAKNYGYYLVYEFLFDRVGADEYSPRIGKSYTKEDDTHYLVEIFDNVYDSAGNHITADDVVFSYNLTLASGYASNFDDYGDVEKVADYSVRFTLSQPLSKLSSFASLFSNVIIVSETAYDEESFSRKPIGTGPYIMTDFVTDAYCTFEARDDYWAGAERSELAKANAQTIRIDFVSDSSMRMIMLESGTSICNPYLAASDLDSFLDGGQYYGKYNMTTAYNTEMQSLIANVSEDSILSDINMRLACWYAISTPGIVAGLGANATSPCYVPVSSAVGDYQSSWDEIPSYQNEYNLEKAREYLEKAGYKGETVKIVAGTFDAKKNTAMIAAEMLRQAGIQTEVSVVEFVNLTQTLHQSNAWDLYTASASDNDYSCNVLYELFSTGGSRAENGHSQSFIEDEKLESMIQECIRPDGYSIELTTQIIQHIIDNAYGYGCTFATSYVAWDKDVAKIVVPYGNHNTPLWNCCDYYLE